MTVVLPAKAFNALNASMKKLIDPDAFRMAGRRVWFTIEGEGPARTFRATASDGIRLYEETMEAGCTDPEGPCTGSFVPMRVSAPAKCRDVTVTVDPQATIISFDNMAFTSPAVPKNELARSTETIDAYLRQFKQDAAVSERRTSASFNPKYLAQALEAFKDCWNVRVDVGGATDPVLLTGASMNGRSVFRLVLPMHDKQSDPEYRDRLSAEASVETTNQEEISS